MFSRSRSVANALLAILFAFTFDHARAAQLACYPNIPSYMLATYGPSYEADENLLVKQKRHGSVTFTMVADMTSGTNIVRTLFRKTDRGEYCIVLKTPPAAELKVATLDKAGVPLTFLTTDQAPGTQAANEIVYSLGKANTYTPTLCKSVIFKRSKIIKIRVPCPRNSDPDDGRGP